MTDFTPIIGAPFLRLMADGSVCNAFGNPLTFRRSDNTTTTFINGKVRRVKREDILRCAAERSDISMLYPKRQKKTPPPSKRNVLRKYKELSENISLFASCIIENDEPRLLLHFVERIPCYMAHFAYLRMSADDLRDYIFDVVQELAHEIMTGDKAIVAPDRYVIKMVRTKMAQDKERLKEKRLGEYD